MPDKNDLWKSFTYPPPKEPERYTMLREAAHTLAEKFNEECPESREKSLALTKLEEAVFWAIEALALNE